MTNCDFCGHQGEHRHCDMPCCKCRGWLKHLTEEDIAEIKRERGEEIITCCHCGKEVEIIRYGNGWVGVCCGHVVYNEKERPKE